MGTHELAIETIARGLVFHGEHVLVCRDTKRGYCYLPGGHVEFGEPAGVALAREFMEEAGVVIRVGACVLVHEHLFRQKGRLRHELNLVFHVELDPPGKGGAPAEVPSREPKIAFDWVRADALADTDFRPASIAGLVRSLRTGACRWMSDVRSE